MKRPDPRLGVPRPPEVRRKISEARTTIGASARLDMKLPPAYILRLTTYATREGISKAEAMRRAIDGLE